MNIHSIISKLKYLKLINSNKNRKNKIKYLIMHQHSEKTNRNRLIQDFFILNFVMFFIAKVLHVY